MISIIIPSYNSKKTIEQTLNSILNQNFKEKYEIIVVDSSSDETSKIISKFPIRLIKQKPRGPAAARNKGVKNAIGEIIVFIDADCVAPKNWLKNLLKPFRDKNTVAVAGTYKTINKDNMIARFVGYEIEQRHEKMKSFKKIDFVATFNCAYRKKIFLKFRGFNEKMTQAEDADLSFRIAKKNYKIKYQPSAFVYHYHPNSLMKYLKQKFLRGYWKIFLYLEHKKRVLGNTYTPRTLFLQILFQNLFFLLFFIGFFYQQLFSISFIFLILTYFLNIELLKFLWRREKIIIIPTILIIFLKNIVSSVGLLFGFLNFLKDRINKY